jgi:hypothetical protein
MAPSQANRAFPECLDYARSDSDRWDFGEERRNANGDTMDRWRRLGLLFNPDVILPVLGIRSWTWSLG